MPLGPPVRVAQWVGLNQLGSNRPERSLTRPPPRARVLTLTLELWRPASPSLSPLDSGELRRTWPPPWCAIDAALDGASIYPRRFDAGDLVLSSSTPSGARVTGSWRSCCSQGSRRDGAAVGLAAVVWGAAALVGAWPGLARCCRALGARRRGRHGCVGCLLAPGTCATLLSHSPVHVLLPPPLVLAPVAPPRGEACRAHALLPCHARCASVCCCAVAVLVVVLLLRWVAVLLLLCCSCCWAPLALAIVAMAMPVLVLLLCAALPCLCARFLILSACLCLPFLLDSSSVPPFMLLCLPDTQVCSFILPWPDDSVSFLQFCKCQSHCVLFLVLKFMIMLN